jgi:integrase
VTLNRELSFLRFLLELRSGRRAPGIGTAFTSKRKNASLVKSEKNRKRERIASIGEYQDLLRNMKRSAQRVLISLFETAMRLNEVIDLTWSFVDEKAGFIRLRPVM